jgi:hypothetical protein
VAANPWFDRLLDEMRTLHSKKNEDYAHEGAPYSNFEHAAQQSGLTVHQVFDVLLGIKTARLVELTRKGTVPNNESVRDSRLDRAMYAALDCSYDDYLARGNVDLPKARIVSVFGEAATMDNIGDLLSRGGIRIRKEQS